MLTEELRRLDLLLKEVYKTGDPRNAERQPDADLTTYFVQRLPKIHIEEIIPRQHWAGYTRAVSRLEGWCGQGEPSGNGNAWGELEVIRQVLEAAIAAPAPVAVSRFPNSKDKDLTDILERDLTEAEACMNAGLWKSAMLLCGSILEAALYEYLRRDPVWSMDSARMAVPRKVIDKKTKATAVRDIKSRDEEDKWSLDDLIKFACMNQVLDVEEAMLHAGIRDARNMIHPNAELRKDSTVDDKSAAVAMAVLQQALDKLGKQKDPPL